MTNSPYEPQHRGVPRTEIVNIFDGSEYKPAYVPRHIKRPEENEQSAHTSARKRGRSALPSLRILREP